MEVGGVVAIVIGVSALYLGCGCHTVPEGHVGAYWQFGRLLTTVTTPGIHFTYPLVTRWESIQVTMQTDKISNIPCGTKGGSLIHFDRIEVVNKLEKSAVYDILLEYGTQYDKTWIYDKVHHEMNQFCSVHSLQEIYIEKFARIDEIMQQALQESVKNHAPGIQIITVRVTKPKIPQQVLRNYEAMEESRTKSLVALQTQKLTTIEAETKKQKEIFEVESRIQKQLMEMEAKLNITRIQNMINVESQKAESDARTYRLEKQAESNAALFSPEYLSIQWADSIGNTTRLFFGPAIDGIGGSLAQVASYLLGPSQQ